MTKVIINPGGDILYKSFYVYALEQAFGMHNVSYSCAPFADLPLATRNNKDMLFVVSDGAHTKEKRYYIACNDFYQINEDAYNWCDVYGSVNANFALTDPRYHAKMVSLCPSFGIQCWSALTTFRHAVADYRTEWGSVKKFLGKHYRLLRTRRPLNEYYQTAPVDKQTIFFCSTLWYSNEQNQNDTGVNLTRANFVRACHSIPEYLFTGGLVPQDHNRSSVNKFQDCIWGGVKMSEWLQRTKQSAVVFNTPAFWNCHGWKLGEYLAMGKCILSTTLSNDLPYPLEHGVDIHIVENSESAMREALCYILSHPDYQHTLEQGAAHYWQQYGTPEATLRLLGII